MRESLCVYIYICGVSIGILSLYFSVLQKAIQAASLVTKF